MRSDPGKANEPKARRGVSGAIPRGLLASSAKHGEAYRALRREDTYALLSMIGFEPLACWNGDISPLATLRIPATERGFFFGDGVYEVIRLYRGKPFLLEEHLARLKYSLEQTRITHDLNRLTENLRSLLYRCPPEDGLAYIQITRGAPPVRSHLFPSDTSPNELLYIAPMDDPLAQFRKRGIRVILCEDTRWHRPDIKSVNLLANVLTRQLANDQGAQEAILERWNGRITEATSSNVFMAVNGTILTPKSDHWILDGISRRLIASLCGKNGIPFKQAHIKKSDLLNAQEVFLSSTTCEVIGVTQVNSTTIGDGMPGPLTQRLYELFQRRIQP